MFTPELRTINNVVFTSFLLFVVFFLVFPDFDLLVSSYFYGMELFSHKGLLYSIFQPSDTYLTIFLLLLFLTYLIWYKYNLKILSFCSFFSKLDMLYMFASLLGTGVIFTPILKEIFHRSRPYETNIFGGKLDFVPFLHINSAVVSDSFPSGHATLGFIFISFIFVFSIGFSRKIFYIASIFGFLFGVLYAFLRVAFLKHYLSDVITAFYCDYFVCFLLYIIFRKYYGYKKAIW